MWIFPALKLMVMLGRKVSDSFRLYASKKPSWCIACKWFSILKLYLGVWEYWRWWEKLVGFFLKLPLKLENLLAVVYWKRSSRTFCMLQWELSSWVCGWVFWGNYGYSIRYAAAVHKTASLEMQLCVLGLVPQVSLDCCHRGLVLSFPSVSHSTELGLHKLFEDTLPQFYLVHWSWQKATGGLENIWS